MKIHSKFHDYYDTALGFGIDPNCHYVRHTKTFQKKSNSELTSEFDLIHDLTIMEEYFDEVPRMGNSWQRLDSRFEDSEAFCLLFCGRLYPFLKVKTRAKTFGGSEKLHFIHNIDDVDRLMKKYGTKKEQEKYAGTKKKKGRSRGWNSYSKYFRYSFFKRRSMVKFFEKYSGITSDRLMTPHYETGIPVFLVNYQFIEHNPCLKEHEFFRTIDAFQAFQELSMFISGVLGGQSPLMVEISNESKIHKAGFDEKSFRKEKEIV